MKLLFSLFDADRNGKLTGKEIRDLIEMVTGSRVDDSDLAKATQFIDTNSDLLFSRNHYEIVVNLDDGAISIDEFEEKVVRHVPMTSLNVKNLFKSFGK